MAGFGGAVKLTGESEYRSALKNITQSLREVSSQLQLNTAKFDANDKSVKNLAQQEDALNKIYKAQETEVAKLRTAYTDFSKKVDDQNKAHKELEQTYQKEKAELEKIAKQSGTNSKEYQTQKEKVDDLQKALAKSRQENDNNRNALSRMGTALNKAETDLVNTAKKMDELGKETEQTGKQVKSAGDGFTVFKGVLSNLASTAITTAINGMKKLAGAVISVGKQALDSYADYEQLVGGVETLFKDSAKEVQGYAEVAYKTAGLSANKYMETVTSFSASLLQGLNGDTAKTAKIADMAIIDMADNANKMGTSMEMIQNAYQGFAKQNYTMLDNLKLGYGGTKTEMVRLINDSKILNHEIKNLDDITFDQIIQAIHVVQTNIGITGTTAKEADSTIQGSVASMKSAWQNLLTGIADSNQDFGKLFNNFIDSVITVAKNIVPRIKEIVGGIKNLVKSLISDVFPKLKKEIPELRPLIEVFEWFIKNKTLVVNAVKLMVGAFVASKIANFTKSISDGAKGLLEMCKDMALATTATTANTTATVANTTATVAGTTATKGMAVAQGLLNKAWQANPIGMVIAGVTALIGVISLLTNKTKELNKAEQEERDARQEQYDEIQRTKDSLKELADEKQNAINAGMTEIAHYQNLYDELTRIVDENGRVKEGYEARAGFITSTLKDALGVEIDLVDGQIQGYSKLRDSIDDVMQKKKAEIILQSQEALYTEAINKRFEASKKLGEIEDQLNAKNKEKETQQKILNDIEAEYNRILNEGTKGAKDRAEAYLEKNNMQIRSAENTIKQLNKETDEIQRNYDAQRGIVEEYAFNISQYENNLALSHQGNYDAMTQVNYQYVKDYQSTGDAKKAQLEDEIKVEKTYASVLKDLKEKSGDDMYNTQVENNKKTLANQEETMKAYTATTEEGLNNTEVVWSDSLDEQLSILTGSKIEFKDAGNGQVQAYVDGEKIGAPKSKEEMAKIATESINELRKQRGFSEESGGYLVEGINNGMINKESTVFQTIKDFGKNLLATFKNSLQEQSPSKATKQMGEYLLEGLGLGIKKEQKSVLSQVANLGKSIISTFDNSLTSESLSANLSAQIQNGIPTNINTNVSAIKKANGQDSSYNTMLLAFQDALASMKIELDDEEAGRFVRRTVENAIYT